MSSIQHDEELKDKIMEFIQDEPLHINLPHGNPEYVKLMNKFTVSIQNLLNIKGEKTDLDTVLKDVFSPFFDRYFGTPLFSKNDRKVEILRLVIMLTNNLDKYSLISHELMMIFRYSFQLIENQQGTYNHDAEKRNNRQKEVSIQYIRKQLIPLSKNIVLARIFRTKNDMRSLREISKTRIVSGIRGAPHSTKALPWDVMHPQGKIAQFLGKEHVMNQFTKKSKKSKRSTTSKSKNRSSSRSKSAENK